MHHESTRIVELRVVAIIDAVQTDVYKERTIHNEVMRTIIFVQVDSGSQIEVMLEYSVGRRGTGVRPLLDLCMGRTGLSSVDKQVRFCELVEGSGQSVMATVPKEE